MAVENAVLRSTRFSLCSKVADGNNRRREHCREQKIKNKIVRRNRLWNFTTVKTKIIFSCNY